MSAPGRQSAQTEQRSSVTPSRCKTADRVECPSALRGTSATARLPVFPLNSSSPPSSPKEERPGQEGEKKRLTQSGQCHQPPPGSRSGGGSRDQKGQGRGLCSGKGLLSESQVRLLVGLHYLPHEHGPSAQKLLQDLTWLKSNCHLVSTNNKKSPPQKVSIHFLFNFLLAKRSRITFSPCFFKNVSD